MESTKRVVDEIIVKTLLRVGNKYKEENDDVLAQKSYQEALELQEKLTASNPKKHQPLMVETLNALAILYANKQMHALAIGCYRKVITIGRMLYRDNESLEYISLLAQTYTNIAKLHHEYHDEKLAKYFYGEAVDSYLFIMKKENYSYHQINLLKNYLALIEIYESESLFNEARDNYDKALVICEDLIDLGFNSYIMEKSKLHCDLASLYFFQNVFDLAKDNYQVSLNMLSSLENLDSDMEIESFAIIHNNLASIYAFEEDYTESLRHYKEALPYLSGLADKNPAKFGQNVAILFKNLASVYYYEKNLEKAQFFHLKSIEIFKEFVEYNAEKYNIELALCIVDGVEYYHQHSINLYRAESILRKYDWHEEAEMLLGRISSLRQSLLKERV